MKKKFAVLAVTAIFSMGLACYANYQSDLKVLLDSNVEALSDGGGDPGGGVPYMEFGTSPNRVIVDNETHVIVIENMKQAYDYQGNLMNGCVEEVGSVCVIRTTTWVYNTTQILDHVASFINSILPLIQMLIG